MPSKATQDVATLADRLGALAGEEYVDLEPAVTIHGLQTSLEVCPADAHQLSEVLKLADRECLGVCISGGGTKMGWGNRPSRFDMVVCTRRLRGFSQIDADNLTLSAWAGTTVSEVRAQARALDRTLPLDSRRPSAATVGGVVASGDQGARGAGYGSVRDVVLGLKAVLADGSQLKLGGRTMKNVIWHFGSG